MKNKTTRVRFSKEDLALDNVQKAAEKAEKAADKADKAKARLPRRRRQPQNCGQRRYPLKQNRPSSGSEQPRYLP